MKTGSTKKRSISVFSSFPRRLKPFCFVIVVFLISCLNLPKETYLSNSSLNGINKLAIVFSSISVPKVIYVQKGNWSGTIVEASMRYWVDNNLALEINDQLDAERIRSKMVKSFIQMLEKMDRFQAINYIEGYNYDLSNLKNMGYDAVIRLSVNEILLREKDKGSDYLILSAQVRAQLENLRSTDIVWDRVENVTNTESHRFEYYKENRLKEIDTMLEKAGIKLAYDIIYLK
jgi:hypothetical protein